MWMCDVGAHRVLKDVAQADPCDVAIAQGRVPYAGNRLTIHAEVDGGFLHMAGLSISFEVRADRHQVS